MLRALLRRGLAGLAVIIGVVTLMFFLIRLAPGDPAVLLVGPTASEAQLAAQRKALGLDRPLTEQYATWVSQFVHGDWLEAFRHHGGARSTPRFRWSR